ncbi:MAG: hypothetical protein U0232_21660 [Thermomicrobiales bacterium]
MAASRFGQVRNVAGVYLLLDLDERPLYVGQSGKLRDRLVQHFVRQDSSATADGLLDIYDVLRIVVWYAGRWPAFSLGACEAALYRQFPPRWNRAVPRTPGEMPPLTLAERRHGHRHLDAPHQLAVRRDPLEARRGEAAPSPAGGEEGAHHRCLTRSAPRPGTPRR